MRTRSIASTLVVLALASPGLHAQEPPQNFLLATYYECNYANEGTADVMMQRLAPVMRKHVDAGHLTAFNMAAHVMGGAWRRLVSLSGPRDALLDVWSNLDQELQEADPVAFAAFNNTCGSHQDYLWAQVASSPAPATPPPANQFRLSTYFFCNQAQEETVDSLVIKTVGPELQKHVNMGHLYGWSWLRHDNGGNVRRVLSFTGPTMKALFQMRTAVFDGIGEEAANQMFAGACGNHFEYVWATVPLTP